MRRRKRKKKFSFGKLLVIVLIILGLKQARDRRLLEGFLEIKRTEDDLGYSEGKRNFKNIFEEEKTIDIGPEEINSKGAYLIDMDSNKLLLNKNGEERIYPASLTKIMTSILAIENLENLDQKVLITEDIISKVQNEGASIAGFQVGEEVRVIDLIYATILPSGGDASLALAKTISGTEEEFASLMNRKAEEIGMTRSNFTNSTGLHNENQYSTVEDISILLKYSLENDLFRQVISSEKYYIKETNLHPEGIMLYSTVFEKLNSMDNNFIKGGKTGFTSEAGLCLASFAEKDGRRYILVTAGADGNSQTEQFNFLDAIEIYNRIRSY